jgi:hypothetical protein
MLLRKKALRITACMRFRDRRQLFSGGVGGAFFLEVIRRKCVQTKNTLARCSATTFGHHYGCAKVGVGAAARATPPHEFVSAVAERIITPLATMLVSTAFAQSLPRHVVGLLLSAAVAADAELIVHVLPLLILNLLEEGTLHARLHRHVRECCEHLSFGIVLLFWLDFHLPYLLG